MNRFFLTTAMMVLSTVLYAQITEELCGEYTYYLPRNVSIEQAEKRALHEARLETIAERFGVWVTQFNIMATRSENDIISKNFFSYGGNDVKGEWVRDTRKPEYKISFEDEMLAVHVSTCFIAREITRAGVDFSAKTLRNGTEDKFESTEFRHGDDIFLSFRSPIDGYIAVYLVDEDSQTAFCLLPYGNDPTGKVKVNSQQKYVFFSKKHVERSEVNIVREYVMTCKNQIEHNLLYIIFSPNEFTKALDSKATNETVPQVQLPFEVVLPRQLPFDDFQKWLHLNRQRDNDMDMQMKILTIKK